MNEGVVGRELQRSEEQEQTRPLDQHATEVVVGKHHDVSTRARQLRQRALIAVERQEHNRHLTHRNH